jgi:hypothetical protein
MLLFLAHLQNVNVRAFSTAAPATESNNGRAIKSTHPTSFLFFSHPFLVAVGVAGALAVAGTVLYVRGNRVYAAEAAVVEKQKEYFNKYPKYT